MSTMLVEHGTELSRLKPVNIVQAAERDLRLRERKRENKADAEEQYCFDRRHVNRARDIAHLIALAFFEPHNTNTNKRSTRIVYFDRDLLRETLATLLAGQRLDAMPRMPAEDA